MDEGARRIRGASRPSYTTNIHIWRCPTEADVKDQAMRRKTFTWIKPKKGLTKRDEPQFIDLHTPLERIRSILNEDEFEISFKKLKCYSTGKKWL